jgi:hypothetical protein
MRIPLEPTMDDTDIGVLQNRTEAKLRFAQVHLGELDAMKQRRGDDFDRAHQESFLYHLLGVRDAFIAELNSYYQTGLNQSELTLGKLRDALKKTRRSSPELAILYKLENDPHSWFSAAKNMRDQATHHRGVKRTFRHGGEHDGEVWLHDPKTTQTTQRDFVSDFKEWHAKMKELVEQLRRSALTNGVGSNNA